MMMTTAQDTRITITVTLRNGRRLTYEPQTPEQEAEWCDTLPFIFQKKGDRVEVQETRKPATPRKMAGSETA